MYRVPGPPAPVSFAERSQIRPYLESHGCETNLLVIERLDDSKVVFRCKHKTAVGQCPFKVRANYSLRKRVWTLRFLDSTHNHRVEGLVLVMLRDLPPPKLPGTGVFLAARQRASEEYVEDLVKGMTDSVAKMVAKSITKNEKLTQDQKDEAVGKFVAAMVDGYLGDTRPSLLMPLSPLLNDELDIQLPALDGGRGTGPLPPFRW